MRKERKILRFVPQKLRKSFTNGNPKSDQKCGNSLDFLNRAAEITSAEKQFK